MNVRYRVELNQAERCELTAMLRGGKRAARKLKRAQILLAADAGCSDEEIARTVAVKTSCGTGERPMASKNIAVGLARGKVGKIRPRMPIQKNVGKRFSEPMKSAGVYEG